MPQLPRGTKLNKMNETTSTWNQMNLSSLFFYTRWPYVPGGNPVGTQQIYF